MNTTVGSVTIIGQKHINRGVPCEDSSIAVQKNGVSAVVVADGAGSKQYTHARFGSKACVETVSDLLTEHFDALYNENREAAIRSLIIANIHIAFADLIKEMQLESIEQLSCTLLFCAVKDRRVLAGHIGDGLMVRISSDGICPLTMPQNDAAGHTYFVTANHAADYLRIVKTTTDNLHAVCLMTDGVQDSVYDENSGLCKPVIARMVETAAGGREKSESEIKAILTQYIVGASNVSDDSSFGILLMNGTKGPDAGKLPKSADKFGKSQDSFKDLQNEMLPAVKKAKQIITTYGTNPAPKGAPAGDDEPEVKAVNKPAPVKKDEKEDAAQETKMKIDTNPANKGSWVLKSVALLELIAIILLLIKILFLGE